MDLDLLLRGDWKKRSKLLQAEKVALPQGPRRDMVRHDGSIKGSGYFGPLEMRNGNTATEVGVGGKYERRRGRNSYSCPHAFR